MTATTGFGVIFAMSSSSSFPCGAVVVDGTLFVYYGGADKYCAVATCNFEQMIQHLLRCPD